MAIYASDLASRGNGFTALRLCAAWLVLITHSYVLLGQGDRDPLARLTGGWVSLSSLGVDVFFAISGFLICQSLMRQPSPLYYLRNRCLRILPALATVIILTVFVLGPLITADPDYLTSGRTYKYLLGMLVYPWQGFLPGVFNANPVLVVNGSLWTLPLEFTWYFILLGISWCGALNWRGFVLLTGGCLALLLSDAFLGDDSLFGMSLLHLDRLGAIFCGGALLATLGNRVPYSRVAASIAVALILAAFWWAHQVHWHRFAAVYIALLPYVVVTTALFLRRLDWLNRWDFSYGFYLYAFLVQQFIVMQLGRDISVFTLAALSTAATALCAMMSWFLVEKRALRLKARPERRAQVGSKRRPLTSLDAARVGRISRQA